jgi:uncharacterized membrane protein
MMKLSLESDHDVEQIIGRLLQVGVLISTAVVLVGGILLLAREGTHAINVAHYQAQPQRLNDIGGIIRDGRSGGTRATIQLGVLLLIATPIARVALTLLAFLYKRDWLYVAMTSLVLGLLLFGFIWGKA